MSRMRFGHCLLLMLFPLYVSASFNYTNCDHAKKPKMLGSCCKIQRDDQVSKACRKSLLSKNTNSDLKSNKVELHACIAECVFRTNGYLQVNGSVNITAMNNDFLHHYDVVLAELMIKSLSNCVVYAKQRNMQVEWLHTKSDCDYFPAALLACIIEQVYENCPASNWKNSEDCTAMRQYLIACDDIKEKTK